MKAIGIKVSIMGREHMLHPLVQNTLGPGCMENIMGLEALNGPMGLFTKANGKIAGKMEMESL